MRQAVSTPVEHSEPKSQPNGGVLFAGCLPVLLLAIIVLACFWATLGSFFLADDFSQVVYASKIVGGNFGMLLSNFTGSYMQNPMMKIYRPCLLLSLVWDYALWRTNAFGYFFTDILLLFASALMLYLLLRQVTNSWGERRSVMFSLMSAALFASNPLHCESISFVSGRDNVISAFFYLLALWCFVKNGVGQSRKLVLVGIASFWISMLSKEMGIGLPLTLAGMAFFLPDAFQAQKKYSIKERFVFALRVSMPIWISAVLYLLVRFVALGTVTGGYVGGGGAGLMTHLFERWTNLHTIFEIICPLSAGVFNLNSRYKTELSLVYVVLGALACYRLFAGKGALRTVLGWSGMLILWTLTTVIPLYQLWGLGPNLEGARFLFFLTMPMAIYLPMFIYAPQFDSIKAESRVESNTLKFASAALAALVVWNVCVAARNNIPWVFAGHQTRACMEQAQTLASALPAGRKLLVLGLPKEEKGAYMISNCATFNAMVSPPFAKSNFEDRFVTFDPIFYGRPELINAQRFERLILHPQVVGAYVWRDSANCFERLQIPGARSLSAPVVAPVIDPILPAHDVQVMPYTTERGVWDVQDRSIRIDGGTKGSGIVVSKINVDPFLYDFVELELTGNPEHASSGERNLPVVVFWQGQRSSLDHWCDTKHPARTELRPFSASRSQRIRIRLSDHWQWFTEGEISRLRIELPPNETLELRAVHLVPGELLMPKLSVLGLEPTGAGVYPVGKEGIRLFVDGTAIKDCASVRLELTKPNYFFADFPDDSSQCVSTTIPAQSHEQLEITAKQIPTPAYYELRAVCLDKGGRVLGEVSDPITIQRY